MSDVAGTKSPNPLWLFVGVFVGDLVLQFAVNVASRFVPPSDTWRTTVAQIFFLMGLVYLALCLFAIRSYPNPVVRFLAGALAGFSAATGYLATAYSDGQPGWWHPYLGEACGAAIVAGTLGALNKKAATTISS
jgi:hypothetical protein